MRSINDLKKYIRESKTPDDIVGAIIYISNESLIPKSNSFLHGAFQIMKEHEPSLFSEFWFDESGIAPYSDQLDEVLFRLEASAILSTLNPTYKRYIINNQDHVLEESYNKFAADTGPINNCARIFKELIKGRTLQ